VTFHVSFLSRKITRIDETVFVDPTARLIGEIVLESGVSIWPFVLLRADSNRITVGERSALLDKVMVEAPKDHPVMIEREVLISHGLSCMVVASEKVPW